MNKRTNMNKAIIKTSVITITALTALSAGLVVTSTALSKEINKSDYTQSSRTSEFSSEILDTEPNYSQALSATASDANDYLASPSDPKDDSASVSDANPDSASASDANPDSAGPADEEVKAGKVLPEIESIISGAKVDKLVPEPEDESDTSNENSNGTDSSEGGNNSGTNKPKYPQTTTADYTKVEGDYFDDAAFIGNSRTEGLLLYTTVSGIDLAYTGLNVSTAYSTPAININGEKVPVMEAVKHKSFKKAYIMFGVNEVGWMSADTFISYYRQIIQDVRAANPDAIIYVQSMLPVTKEFEQSRGDITNNKIMKFNKRLKALAKEQGVIYLNIAEYVANKEGYLPSNASPDGYHLNQTYCEKWYTFLKKHAIVK